MDSPFAADLVGQEAVQDAVALGEGLAAELGRRDDEAEVRLTRDDAAHGHVLRVQVRVVVDLEPRRCEGGGDLHEELALRRAAEAWEQAMLALSRMVSSMGEGGALVGDDDMAESKDGA